MNATQMISTAAAMLLCSALVTTPDMAGLQPAATRSARRVGAGAGQLLQSAKALKHGLTALFALLMSTWLAVHMQGPSVSGADLLSLRVCLAGSVLFTGLMMLQLVRTAGQGTGHLNATAG